MSDRPVVLLSNRGPLSFSLTDGELSARRGAGGLVSGIGPLFRNTDRTWMAAAISEGDREAAKQGVIEAEGFRVRLLGIDPADYRQSYDVVCNAALWFTHHHLFDLARRPLFDHHFHDAWQAYRRVNQAFADAVASDTPDGATVLVQDYHLALVPGMLGASRPDLRCVHFSHTPFAGPDAMRVLPDEPAAELLSSMASAVACGFHTPRWAKGFADSCEELVGLRPATFVSPLAPDPDDLTGVLTTDACQNARRDLESRLGDRMLIARSDRIELSKNIVRGFLSYETLLETQPEWQGRVVFSASVYPSREGLAEYLAYQQELTTTVERINRRFATADWTPIELDTEDNFAASVALLSRADVLLVNPVRDGLNLVAMEGPLVNDQDVVVVLSNEAGAAHQLSEATLTVNPFDITATAAALNTALSMPAPDRAALFATLRERVGARTPATWLEEQLAAATDS
jgi:trehalose 6-phosphate synthase